MTERVKVADQDDFESGSRRFVEVNGQPVGVFNVDGEYYALLNHCLHDSGPVCEGRVMNKLVAEYDEPGERVTEEFSGPPTVTCPWHGWEYDLETGDHRGDPDITLPTYDVVVEHGAVYVQR